MPRASCSGMPSPIEGERVPPCQAQEESPRRTKSSIVSSMNRRDFLQPEELAFEAGRLLGAFQGSRTTPVRSFAPPAVSLLRASARAMATEFEVLLPFGIPNSQEMFRVAFDEIDRLELQLTVYSPSGEVRM